jgi:hypothetical protein
MARAVRNTDSSISVSHSPPTHSNAPRLVLGSHNGTTRTAAGEDITAPTAKKSPSDVSDHTETLKHTSSRRPHRILTLLKGVPAPPVLTSPSSPLESPITTEPDSESNVLYFDDGGALVYHMPEPNSTSEPVSAPNVSRRLSFLPLTPIAESYEPSELSDAASSASLGDLLESRGSLSDICLQSPISESISYFDLVFPLPPSAEQISYFAHLDSIGPHLDSVELPLPNPHPELPCHTIEIQAPQPNRGFIDGEKLRRLLSFTGNDIEDEDDREGVPQFGFSDLEPSLESGDSTPIGPLTPTDIYLHDTALAITPGSSSQFSPHAAVYEPHRPKKLSPFSSMLYVGLPPPPFDPPAEFVFDPFGLDDDRIPSHSCKSLHVGVEIMNKLLAAEDGEEDPVLDPVHLVSPFDQVRRNILEPSFTEAEQQATPSNPALFFDLSNMPGVPDIVIETREAVIDPVALSNRITTWLQDTLEAGGDDVENASDLSSSPSDDACGEIAHYKKFFADDSDSDDDNFDEDFPPVVLEHNGIKYTISGEVGEGTYGQVVLAHTSIGEEVAIKICSKAREGCAPTNLRRAVLNERNILVSISTENAPFLTQPLACFHDENNVYFVLVSFLAYLLSENDC